MMKAFLFLLCLLLSIPSLANAAGKVVSAELSDNFVGISEGFEGAKLTLFGVLRNKADAVVVVKGPLSSAAVRMKSRQLGLWINGDPVVIPSVPSFYAVVSSKPVDKILKQDDLKAYGFDIDHLSYGEEPFRTGFVEVKKEKNLYQYQPGGVRILESNLFRVDVRLPSSVPVGLFEANIYEFSSGKLTAMRTETFQVAQVGLTDRLSRLSRENPALYALLALVLSLSIGGGSAYLLQRRAS